MGDDMNDHDPKNTNRPFRHEGHKLLSRRDFLAQGFIAASATVALPSLLSFGSSRAMAQALDCGVATGGAGKIPFLCIDLAGGANMAGSNVLVGKAGGQLDPLMPEGYEKMGLPTGMFPTDPAQVNTELGLAFHADSAFLRGIRDKTSAATRANVNGAFFANRSDNDTGNNPHNPLYGINKAGANGDLVPLIGSESSESGGKSVAPMSMIDPSVRPTQVSRASQAVGLVDTGKLTELLDQDDAAAVMTAVEALGQLKLDRMTEEQAIEQLVHCGYAQSAELVSRYGDPSVLDPEQDPILLNIFGANDIRNDRKVRPAAAIMKLVVNGFAGAGCAEFGGYDYHDSTRATGEIRDFQAGQIMGGALEYAAQLGQQLCLYVFSDGSVFSDGTLDDSQDGRGKLIWKGDNSSTAGSFMLVYDPAGRPQLTRPEAAQIGYYRENGSVETASTRIASNVELLCEAVVLNYMALHDDVGRFGEVLPNHGLGMAADMDELTAFQPIRNG
ncbi:MAG: general secretion pathway protein GspF [Myxococcota bacterium]|nr:general secretion pathway protein GspF [Myxococcota bacterium]